MSINRMTQNFEYSGMVEALQTFMSQQQGFRDVNWDGSVAKSILRVLAYNAQLQQAGNNFLFNEMDLNASTIPRNAKAIASVLGYTARGKRAARYVADIVVTPATGTSYTPRITLDRKAKFFTNKDGISLYFSVVSEHEAAYDETIGGYVFKNIELVQGRWVSQSYVVQADYTTESYVLPFQNVDTDFIKVGVLANNKTTDIVNYRKFDTVYDLGKDNEVFYLDVNKNGEYAIEFGDDKVSKRPAFGSVVVIEALVTEGAGGNGARSVESVSSVGGHYGVAVNPLQVYSYGGADEDTIENIKRIAPLTYAAQGNAVTSNDFIAITLANFPEAETAISWGGEENDPPMYGYQYVAVKPKNSDVLDTIQKKALENILLQRCVSSVTPIIVDPEFTDLSLRGEVVYSHNSTVLSDQSIKIKITNAVYGWSKANLEFFGSDFIYSDLITFIKGVDASIRGMTLFVDYTKSFSPVINAANSYTFSFNQAVRPGSVRVTGFVLPAPTEIIGWQQDIFDKDGQLYLRYINRDAIIGGERVSTVPQGTVDYATGTIRLNRFLVIGLEDSQGVLIKVTPESQDPSLFGAKRTIIRISDVQLDVRSRELGYAG